MSHSGTEGRRSRFTETQLPAIVLTVAAVVYCWVRRVPLFQGSPRRIPALALLLATVSLGFNLAAARGIVRHFRSRWESSPLKDVALPCLLCLFLLLLNLWILLAGAATWLGRGPT